MRTSIYFAAFCLAAVASTVSLAWPPPCGYWDPETAMPIQASEQCAATVGGKIYVFGAGNSSPDNNRVYEFDPATHVWTRKADMSTGRGQAACAVLDGKVYVVGGNNCFSNCWLRTLERYDPATNTWAQLAPMPAQSGRGYLSAAAVGGRIYVMGGFNSYVVPTFSDNYIYDPQTNSWTTGAALPTPRAVHGAAVVEGEIYLVGGSYRFSHAGPTYFNATVDVYNPATDTWRTAADLPTHRDGPAVVALYDRIYAVGGITDHAVGTPTPKVEEYDPRDDIWRAVTHLPAARSAFAIAAAGGELYVIGGQGQEDGWTTWAGNGHSYRVVSVPSAITWSGAKAAATTAGGYLATVTSGDENAFVYQLALSVPSAWGSPALLQYGPWLGGWQAAGAPEPGGGWTWENGEGAFAYTAWNQDQPDNFGGNEDKLHYHALWAPPGTWNDLQASGEGRIFGYIVERGDGASGPPDMALIPAGEFLMGNPFSGEGESRELPRHAVYVDAFYMDVFEVTNSQYAAALNWALSQGDQITVTNGVVYKYGSDTPYCSTTSSPYSRITWNGSTFGVVEGKEQHPISMVSWYGAVAYCNWRSAMAGLPFCYDLVTWACNFDAGGFRLPTEAEWEKAARGGTAGRRFPWADQDTIQHTRCNYLSSSNYAYDTSSTRGYHPLWVDGSNYPFSNPVEFFDGSLRYRVDWGWPGSPTSYQTASGANGYGLYGMAGNVWEWCNDWYLSDYYSSSPYANPRGPESGGDRVLRGGGYDQDASRCRVAYRDWIWPDYRGASFGFRCTLKSPSGGGSAGQDLDSVLAGIPRPRHGDMNNDGECDFADIDPFVAALSASCW